MFVDMVDFSFCVCLTECQNGLCKLMFLRLGFLSGTKNVCFNHDFVNDKILNACGMGDNMGLDIAFHAEAFRCTCTLTI